MGGSVAFVTTVRVPGLMSEESATLLVHLVEDEPPCALAEGPLPELQPTAMGARQAAVTIRANL
jgi:hypothetical protein